MSGASEIYHQDFHAWAMRNAELIRQGRLAEIDGEHVAEELESMGKSQQRAMGSRLTVLCWRIYYNGATSPGDAAPVGATRSPSSISNWRNCWMKTPACVPHCPPCCPAPIGKPACGPPTKRSWTWGPFRRFAPSGWKR